MDASVRLSVHAVSIPISEFLDRAIHASLAEASGADYAGMVVLATRTADAKSIQQQLFTDWESLDDVTSNHIIVLEPTMRTHHDAGSCIRPPGEVDAWEYEQVVAEDVRTSLHASDAWSREFLAWAPSNDHEPEDSAVRSDSLEDLQAALTRAATEVRRYFQLSERELPCLVVLSMWERELFVVRLPREFTLYEFLREVVIRSEDSMQQHDTVGQVANLSLEIESVDASIRSLPDREARLQSQREALRLAWVRRLDNFSGLVRWLSRQEPSVRDAAIDVREMLDRVKGEEGELATAFELERLRALSDALTMRPDLATSRTGRLLADKFPRVFRDLESQYRPGDSELERLEEERFTLGPRRDELADKLSSLREEAKFSRAVREAAAECGLRELPETSLWSGPGWPRTVMVASDAALTVQSALS